MASERRETTIRWLKGVSLPRHWSETRVKYLAPGMRAGEAITGDCIEPAGTYPVYGGNGIRGFTESFTHSGPQILIGRQGALCGNVHLVSGEFWASEHAIVAQARPGIDPRWLSYLLHVMNLGQYSQTAAQPGIGTTQVGALDAPMPPPDEQRAIADYLDRETARIDELITEQKHLVDLLHERRRAVVDRVVWLGLAQQQTGPTGIDPAPEAPSHWRRARNKDLLQEATGLSVDGSEELLSVSHLTGITPRSEKNVTMIEAESLDGYRLVEPGDLVINTMWAWMGALGVSAVHGVVSPAYGVYRPREGASFYPPYFDYLYRSRPYVVEMTRFSRGIWQSRLRLYPEVFLRLPIVVPPMEEQRTITAYLDAQTSRIDALIHEAECLIDLARERRSALITASVTGQIDVRSGT